MSYNTAEQVQYIVVGQQDAAVAVWGAEAIFLICAVNVDIAIVGIDAGAEVDSRLETSQAKYPCGDPVLRVSHRVLPVAAASGFTANKNHANRLVIADFLHHDVPTQRGPEGVFDTRRGISGRRDCIAYGL